MCPLTSLFTSDSIFFLRLLYKSIRNTELGTTNMSLLQLCMCMCVCLCGFCFEIIIQWFLNLTYQNSTQRLEYENYSHLGLHPHMTDLEALMV